MSRPTLQQKYDYLCQLFEVTDIDMWENDALLRNAKCTPVYFQFGGDNNDFSVDKAVHLILGGR